MNLRTLAKLERAVIKTALIRYAQWLKSHGEPQPWGHPQCCKPKAAFNLIMATKALYEAKRK